MSGEAVAGSIVGFLRLDADQFMRVIEEAQVAADHLDGKDVNVKVKADTAGAETKLAAVAASEDKVDKSNVKVAKSGQDAGKGMGAMLAAVITLGPALVPLAVGTAGLAVGFGAMGAAGVLAVVGIIAEMKKGTPLGLAYSGMLTTLKGDLTTLGHTAAAGVLAPFQAAIADVQTKMPALNSIIGEFSVITGKTAGVLTTGLVAAFISLEPLARDAGVYVLTLSQRFAALMSGPGVVSFGDYARSVFPQVMQAVESIVGAAIRLVAALAPLGLGTLGILRTFTDLINALPVDVLATLAQGASSVYIGFKAFSLLSLPLHSVGTALQFVGVSADTAAAGVRGLTMAAGVVGAIITVATLIYSAHAESVRKDQDAVNSLTDALIRSGGVIDDNTVKDRANALAKDGTLAAAKALGYGIGDVTGASLGLVDATARVTAHSKLLQDGWDNNTAASQRLTGSTGDQEDAFNKVNAATKNGATNLGLATQAYDDYTAAIAKAAAGGNAQAIATQALAAKFGITVPALLAAEDGQKKTADATAAATAKMYLENDAAGILKMGLDLLNGKAISAAQAQNAFDSSLVNMGDHVTASGNKVKFTTTSINDMSAASVSLRGQLIGQAVNVNAVMEANGGLTNSTAGTRAEYEKMRQKIIDNAVAHGVNRDAVQTFIDKILKTPTGHNTDLSVDTTKAIPLIAALQAKIDALQQGAAKPQLGVDTWTAAAQIQALQTQIDALHGKTLTVVEQMRIDNGTAPGNKMTKASANGNIFNAFANGGIRAFASGGESHVAHIAPAGAMRLWAEPETGGEAYIPLAASKRARSTAIYDEVGKVFGKSGQGQAGGGGPIELGPKTIEALRAGNTFNITEAAQNPHAIAAEVAFMMRTSP